MSTEEEDPRKIVEVLNGELFEMLGDVEKIGLPTLDTAIHIRFHANDIAAKVFYKPPNSKNVRN